MLVWDAKSSGIIADEVDVAGGRWRPRRARDVPAVSETQMDSLELDTQLDRKNYNNHRLGRW